MRIPEILLCIGLLCLFVLFTAVLAATAQEKKSQNIFTSQDFNNSVCFQKCHKPKDFSPSDKPAGLWRMLIDKDGHDIFAEIPWKSAKEKEKILRYLLKNAKNAEPESEGIGVW